MEDRKRNHQESVVGGAGQPKRLKLEMASAANGNGNGVLEEESDDVTMFQKQAIYRQMKEYQKLYNDSFHTSKNLESSLESQHQKLSKVLSLWSVIEVSLAIQDSKLAKSLIGSNQPGWEKEIDSSWNAIKSAISSGVQGSKIPTDNLQPKISMLEGELAKKNLKCRSLDEKLNIAQADLRQAEKRIHRLQVAPVPAAAAAPTEKEAESAIAEKKKENMIEQEKYLELTGVAEVRLSQLEILRKEKYTLQKELESAIIQLREAKAGREVEVELRLQLSKQDVLKQELERAHKEIESLQTTRRSYVEQITNEEEKRRKAIEADMKKLEQDITRIRTGRDKLQRDVEKLTLKDSAKHKGMLELKSLSESRKERISTLESEISRLKIEFSGNLGEAALVNFFKESSENPYATLKQENLKLKADLADLKTQLEVFNKQNDTSAELSNAISEEREKIHTLESEIRRYHTTFGSFKDGNVVKKEDDLNLLNTKLEASEKAKEMLAGELDTLMKAWTTLDEQNSKKIFNVLTMEESMSRIQAEKLKVEQKLAVNLKQSNAFSNNQVALKRQFDKQLEIIRKLGEMERSLNLQLQNLEQQLASVSPALLREQRRNEDFSLERAHLNDRIQSLQARVDSLSAFMTQKSEDLEMEKEMSRKHAESAASLRKKYDAIVASGDGVLQSKAESYRTLLMCQSCNSKFKDCCLLKCMHTFCNDCIQGRYESRQRKCPTCSIPFGKEDIKPIYL